MQRLNIGCFEINTSIWPPTLEQPVVIFIHGASLTKDFWNAQIDGLQQMATPVAVDLPGHGGSGGGAQDTIKGYADAISDFIELAELSDHEIVLCGMSMGGGIVQQLILDHPDRFKAAILINTGARLKVHPMIFEAVKNDFDGFVQSMPSVSLSPHTAVDRFEHQIREMALQGDAQTALKDFTACNTFDVMDKIERITCPVLVCSAEHDMSTPPKYGLWLAENLPKTEHIHIKSAGHFSPMEKPEEINQAIRLFLERVLS